MEWDAPSNTLRTCFNNASKGRYVHPEQDRVISLREGARLQSIPDSFKFVGWPFEIAQQIGNSVPPRLGRVVARAVMRVLR
jgi:DNA (cytosine-5)-methyltransferase 1